MTPREIDALIAERIFGKDVKRQGTDTKFPPRLIVNHKAMLVAPIDRKPLIEDETSYLSVNEHEAVRCSLERLTECVELLLADNDISADDWALLKDACSKARGVLKQ